MRKSRTLWKQRYKIGSSGSFTGVIASEELAEEVSLSVQWEGDQMQLDFTAPEDLDGLNVTFQGTSVEVRYREMKLPLLAEEIPEQSVLSALRNTLLEGGQRLTDARWDGQRLLAEGTVGLEPGWSYAGKENRSSCGLSLFPQEARWLLSPGSEEKIAQGNPFPFLFSSSIQI